MFKNILSCGLLLSLCAWSAAQDQVDKVFSGPQVGEAIPGFNFKPAFGNEAGTDTDFVTAAGDNPIVVVFVHKFSRPAFGLANAVMRYCDQEGGDDLHRGICFLSGDPTETQNRLNRIQNYFPENTLVGYSTEGIEGPGAYGLNRNVEVTVIVANQKKVAANFALVQPAAHADGPKILQAIANVTGSDKSPDINKYLPNNQSIQDAPIAIDPNLMAQIRKLNSKDAAEQQVEEAVTEIEKLIKDNNPLQRQLGSVVTRWVRNKRVDSIGNIEHQTTIKQWAKDYGPRNNRRMKRQSDQMRQNTELTGLLRGLIQKTNTDEQVDSAAKSIEAFIEKNPAAEKELARITTTIANSGKLENYGTKHCQEVLKAWAEKFEADK